MLRRSDPPPTITRNELTVELERHNAITLNASAIAEALRFYDCDVNVQAASQILLNSLLSGGIRFKHHTRSSDDEEDAIMSFVWCECMRAATRCAWSVGFFGVVAAPHEQLGVQPRVLDLESLDVDMLQDDSGQCEFFAYSRLHREHNGFVSALARGREARPIPGVHWFVVNAPTRQGDLRALVSTLWADYALEAATIDATLKAERARAEPAIVTEPQIDKPNGARLPSPWDTPSLMNHQTFEPSSSSSASGVNSLDAHRQANDMALARFINTDAALGMTAVSKADMLAQQRRQARMHSSPYQPVEIRLEENQRLARQVLPEAPAQLMQLRLERQHRVFAAFGVPLFLLSHSSARRATMQSDSKSGHDAQASDVFLNSQKALHRRMLMWIKQIYRTTMLRRDVGMLLSVNKRAHKFEAQALLRAAMPDVTIASLPDETAVDKLYAVGALKYSAMCEYYAQKHGFAKHMFSDSPKPPPLVHIPPTVPRSTAGGGAGSTQAKKKRKAQT